jgi:hypothetical protein
MVTVSYGLHRKKSEILVAEMMEKLAKQPYGNIDFLNLKGKYWGYLRKRTKDFVFDVHGSETKLQIPIFDVTIPLPIPTFILYSNITENKYLEFLKKYRESHIFLLHKGEFLCFNNFLWKKVDWKSNYSLKYALGYAKKYNLENRLTVIELSNVPEIDIYHKPFMERFLKDLDSIS